MRDAMSVGCSSDGGNPRVTSRLRKVPGACTKKCAVLATVDLLPENSPELN